MAKPSYLPAEVTTYWDPDEGRVVQPAGSILQVQHFQYTSANLPSLAARTDTLLSNVQVNITPQSSTSIIHLQAHMFVEFNPESNDWDHVFFFYRDSTKLAHAVSGVRRVGISMATRTYYAADNNSTPLITRYDYFDQPNTTSQITYTVGVNANTAGTIGINRTIGDVNEINSYERGISFISATEISG